MREGEKRGRRRGAGCVGGGSSTNSASIARQILHWALYFIPLFHRLELLKLNRGKKNKGSTRGKLSVVTSDWALVEFVPSQPWESLCNSDTYPPLPLQSLNSLEPSLLFITRSSPPTGNSVTTYEI